MQDLKRYFLKQEGQVMFKFSQVFPDISCMFLLVPASVAASYLNTFVAFLERDKILMACQTQEQKS